VSWVRLDDAMPEHPKIAGLSDAAFRLHVSALCYSGRHLTDGEISRGVLRLLGVPPRRAAELVSAGVWTRDADELQPSLFGAAP
jgi:hypothetical protein